jgi:hypothetical protein
MTPAFRALFWSRREPTGHPEASLIVAERTMTE